MVTDADILGFQQTLIGIFKEQKMAEENQEQVTEVVQEEPKVETPEVSKEKLFTEAEVGEIIENRIER